MGEWWVLRSTTSSIFKKSFEIFLMTKKSIKSGVFSRSVGQYVGLPVDIKSHPYSSDAFSSCLPLRFCKGNHPAKYKGSSIYKQQQEKSFPCLRSRSGQSELSNNKKESNGHNFETYSHALKAGNSNKNKDKHENSPTASSQQNDMADMKAMMKTLIEQMSTMMNLLTTVISKLV